MANEKKTAEAKENRKRKHEQKKQERAEKSKRESLHQFDAVELECSDEDSGNDTMSADPNATFNPRSERLSKRKPLPKYKHTMLISERYHIHERPSVALINMVVKDLHEGGFLKEGVDLEQVMVDRNRVKKLKEEYSADIVAYT